MNSARFVAAVIGFCCCSTLRAFTSCPPDFTVLLAVRPAECTTGHYQITINGLNFTTFGLSSDALAAVAFANIGVDGSENYFGHTRLGVSTFLPNGAYVAAHHFDRKGLSVSDQDAFTNGAAYVQTLRNAFLAQLSNAQNCVDVLKALQTLGQTLHAIQDVYSHSNYIDLPITDRNLIDLAVTNPSFHPPLSLRMTGYDPGAPDDPEYPFHDLYPHGGFAKDYPGKNAQAIQANFAAARDAATVASYAYALGLQTQAGSLWGKLTAFHSLSSCVGNPNLPIQIITSGDPNDKSGSQGVGQQQYLSGSTPLRYLVSFSNEISASAAAQKVVITDQLDGQNEDLTTFSLGVISLPNQSITPPPGPGDFSKTVDLRPANNLLVSIKTHLNSSGLMTWTFQSLDPLTNQPPTDPTAGFLPAGTGGGVFFTLKPRAGVVTGTQVQNQAVVIFDTNAPINTPVWVNTIDNTPPTSRISGLANSQSTTTFPVAWVGTDVGAGVQDYTVSVSDNGSGFVPWLTNSALTSSLYHGTVGHSYSFIVSSRDLTGNTEPGKTVPDASTTINSVPNCASNYTDQFAVTQGGYRYNNATKQFVQTLTLVNTSPNAFTGLISLALDSLSPNATLVGSSGKTACSVPAGSPYVNLNLGATGSFASGQSISTTLLFSNPAMTGITYTPRVIIGAQGR